MMSGPERQHYTGKNSRPKRDRPRGQRRPYRSRGPNSHRPAEERQNVHQPSETTEVFDWYDGAFKTVQPNENQDQNDWRSSSPCSQSSQGPDRGRRRNQNHGRNQHHGHHQNHGRNWRDSSESIQSKQQGKPGSRYFKFNQLMTLSKMTGNNIATEISDNPDFMLVLDSNMNKDFLVLTLRILGKLEQANFTRIVINILSKACQTKFLENLEQYLIKLPLETEDNRKANKFYWEDVDQFWNHLHDFFKIVVDFIPLQAHDELLRILRSTTRYTIDFLKTKQGHEIDEILQARIQMLYFTLKEKVRQNAQVPGNEMLQDFRTLSIVPTVEDLNDHTPYIRPCKIEGSYDSVDHYLDVQFRLLREDFICPLRTGIHEYKRLTGTDVRTSQISDIRVFQKVKLIGPTVVKNKVGVTVFFGLIPKMNWMRSKLFMYGSLLCLTNDNFRSVLFATVADADPQLLEKGELTIEPCVGTKITRDMYNCEYVMVESKVYFLPYYHTLNSLRYMSEKDFPMKKYVVDAESIPRPPKYLEKNRVYAYKGFEIPVMDVRRWPSASRLGLDVSQYEAFKCALLQELSVLHGPPGTGKTFMALEIASTLLANSSSWYNPERPTPMIVVCLTNHALDQFLEGILSHTESLVRIGEQSKNPNLAKYKLKAVRNDYYKDEKKKDRAWQRMTYYQRQSNRILTTLGKTYSVLRALTSDTSIVSPNVLRQYCRDYDLQGLTPQDLLTSLFGAERAALAIGINSTLSDSPPSEADYASDSENEYIDADDDLEVASVVHENNPEFTCLEMSHLDASIEKYEAEISTNQSKAEKTKTIYLGTELKEDLRLLKSLRFILQAWLNHHPLLTKESARGNYPTDRDWEMYCHWLTSSHEVVKNQIIELEEEFQEICSQLNDFKQMTDLEVMRNSLVVGLTTTGAARLHESLRALRSPIVLVEEAAEILEAHVICSLTEHCQQVILIGDHKQLRPKPATYNLEVNYNLNISLFERIVKMRDKCTQLVIQHRMRPEIAELISPSIYETLENHISVFTYPAVKGMDKNLFFLNHQNHESGSMETESVSNPFEVKFLLNFAKYLIQQGYAPDEITILCTYNGQLFKFKESKKGMPVLRDVRVTTVDNYQGEENRIILLSLVRNNTAGNIGFLKTENRVCVALSRAREGLYIMGNMNNLLMKNQIWPKINDALKENNAIGDCLVLQCQIHCDQLTQIRRAADFKNSPNGGCLRNCDAPLPCGHTCQKLCHLLDRNHKDHVCKEPCLKKCPNGHRCKLLCKAACQPCQEIVEVEFSCHHSVLLPCNTNLKEYRCTTTVSAILRCGHTVEKPCHRESSTFPCTHICKKPLPCGHMCVKKCHIDDDPRHLKYVCRESCKRRAIGCPESHLCSKKCYEECGICTTKIPKERFCGHTHKVACSQDVNTTVCTQLGKRDRPCGHSCEIKCNLPFGRCQEMVDKIIPDCGHEVKIPCYQNPLPGICRSKCSRTLNCGHPCTALCCEPCTKRCEYPRPLLKPALCQHLYPVPCYKIEIGLADYADKLLQHCTTPCATMLPCGHMCSGNCGSCKQGRIHQPCRERCSKILVCGHKCESLCKDICRPCNKTCFLRCQHAECTKKCGVPCTPCQKPCSWRCKHLKCEKLCSEICDIDFCNEPCPKRLKCGHPCIGFCGEVCPPLCRICNGKDLPVFSTDKNKPDPRFVFLPECNHCIESNYLDWQWQRSYRIGIKVCPICETRITSCTRYANQIKKELRNMEFVDKETTGRLQLLRADQQKVLKDIDLIEKDYTTNFPASNAHKKLFESLRSLVNQRKNISATTLKDISIKLRITGMVLRKVLDIPHSYRDTNDWPVVVNQMIMLITSLPTTQNISQQMMDDIKHELFRLHYMIQLCKFEKDRGLNKQRNALRVEIIYLGLLNLEKFTNSRSDTIYKQLFELKESLESHVSVDELKEITFRIMGLEQEDWYRCPNGHIYLVECRQCQSLTPTAPTQS